MCFCHLCCFCALVYLLLAIILTVQVFHHVFIMEKSSKNYIDDGHSIEVQTHAGHALDRLQYVFALCDPVTSTFDLLT